MTDGKNRQQAQVDIVVKAAKDRRRLVEVAARGQIAPESLSLDEIKRIAAFVVSHGTCWDTGTIG